MSNKTPNTLDLSSNQDLISSLPDNAIDKILKRLPIKMVAQMSILSKKWRLIWFYHKYLIFDEYFWDKIKYDYASEIRNYNSIISNILFHHVGPLHEFHLYVPDRWDDYFYSGWLSLLSKLGVKKVTILIKSQDYLLLPSFIFDCKDLVKLRLESSILNLAPSHFKGFAYLRNLELVCVQFKHDVFRSLIESCPQLVLLKLYYCTGMNDHLVIDAPNLQHLTISDNFATIAFKNVPRLSFLSLSLDQDVSFEKAQGVVDNSMEMLSSSCQLQELHFGGFICKYFGAGCTTMSRTLTFLNRLQITEVDLNDFDEFCFTLGMIQCCPFIKDLEISVHSKECDVEHEFESNKNCELRNLLTVEITNLIGSRPEFKLIEYLFSIASKLEMLAFKCCKLDPISELKVTRGLSELPRASPKAKLVCLDK